MREPTRHDSPLDPARRRFLRDAAHATLALTAAAGLSRAQTAPTTAPLDADRDGAGGSIDRKVLVARHNVALDAVDLLSPLAVGNGEFAFACDVTGLQTLADAHRDRMPLNTMAQWAWHRTPNPNGYTIDPLLRDYDVGGRKVSYADNDNFGKNPSPAASYLRANPHRIALARIALIGRDGAPIRAEQLTAIDQTLDLWTGVVRSRFRYAGQPVDVTTAAHPTRDAVAFRIAAPGLFTGGDLAIRIAFPAACEDWRNPDDWNAADAHQTTLRRGADGAQFERAQDGQTYVARAAWAGGRRLDQQAAHTFDLFGAGDALDLVVEFAPRAFAAPTVDASAVVAASASSWAAFWSTGAAVDFSACSDPRAVELERRVVLSQYLTAVHCAGSMPPQVTGLAFNSWYGKPQLETHPLMSAHFATWGRFPLLERSLGYYGAILAEAQKTARRQGYDGARWPKMTDPDGRDSPSLIGPFLVWQQPHPIYLAELAYRAAPTRETLDRYAELVEQSARFLASYPTLDAARGRYVLGPAIVPAQESYWQRRATTINPTFELAYWAWGLTTAQKWRERLGRPREDAWAQVVAKLSVPSVRDHRYAAAESPAGLHNGDHPSFLMALGYTPKTRLIDEDTMRQSLRWTKAKWKWNESWGWDFAIAAMTAARLGDAEAAVDLLSVESERNRFLPNGHNFQTDRLPAYLPGNGALLMAVALMAGGWDGGPTTAAPGFPTNGAWNVRAEGFAKTI